MLEFWKNFNQRLDFIERLYLYQIRIEKNFYIKFNMNIIFCMKDKKISNLFKFLISRFCVNIFELKFFMKISNLQFHDPLQVFKFFS